MYISLLTGGFFMITGARYTFGKEERLRSRDAIRSLFANGKSFNVFPLKIYWSLSDEPGLRAAVSVSSSLFKKSTHRNRIKRLLRESYRLQKNDLKDVVGASGHGMNIFLLYRGKDLPEFELIYERTGTGLNRILKELNETDKQDT